MKTPDFAQVDRILVSGQWLKIAKGSLKEGAGVAYRTAGGIKPLLTFKDHTGAPAAIVAEALQGWAPLKAGDEPPLYPELDAVAARSGYLPPSDGSSPLPHRPAVLGSSS